LRFPEFSGEWELVRLGDVCKFFSGGTPSSTNKDFYGGDIPFIRSGEIHSSSTELYISEAGLNSSSAKIIEQGDLLLALYGATSGDIAISKIKGAINQAILCIRTNHDNFFLKSCWEKHCRKLLQTYLQGGQGNLSADIVKSIKMPFPSCLEQKKISGLLALIEERITTQKKIIEDLKKLKDAICNMNFTSGSALKLGNVGKFVRGLTYSASDIIDDTMGTAVMRSNNISNGDPANFEELIWVNKTPNHEQILRGGDIIICMANGSSPLVGKASYYIDCGMESATVGAFCGIYRSYNPLTKWLFQSKHYKKHIQRCIQGGNGAIANIYPEDILAISFNIPSGYERVLNVLNSLEEKYLLEQKLLYRYLAVKSHLLAQLFI